MILANFHNFFRFHKLSWFFIWFDKSPHYFGGFAKFARNNIAYELLSFFLFAKVHWELFPRVFFDFLSFSHLMGEILQRNYMPQKSKKNIIPTLKTYMDFSSFHTRTLRLIRNSPLVSILSKCILLRYTSVLLLIFIYGTSWSPWREEKKKK